jgi:hypothetical protein
MANASSSFVDVVARHTASFAQNLITRESKVVPGTRNTMAEYYRALYGYLADGQQDGLSFGVRRSFLRHRASGLACCACVRSGIC